MSFKIYADFESLVQRINKDNNASYTEKYQEQIPCSFVYKIWLDDRFNKITVLYREENAIYRSITSIIEE